MSRGLGIGIGIGQRSGNAVLDALFARAQIAGRDGVVTESRGTQRTSIFDGSLKAAGVPAQGTVRIGNRLIPCFAAFSQSTNVFPWSHLIDNALAFSYATTTERITDARFGTALRVTMTAADAYWYSQQTVSVGAPSTASVYMRRTPGSARTAATLVRAQDGAWAVNLHPLADEWERISCTATQNANSGVVQVGFDNRSWAGGDGQLGSFDVAFLQHEAGAIVSPPIPTSGTSVTQNADLLTWVLRAPITPPYDLLLFTSLYSENTEYHKAIVGNDKGNPLALNLYHEPNDLIGLTYGGNAPSPVGLSQPLSHGRIDSFLAHFSGNEVDLSQNGGGAFATVSGIAETHSALLLGQSFYHDAQLGGAIAALCVAGGLTPAEHAAVETLRQKSVVLS